MEFRHTREQVAAEGLEMIDTGALVQHVLADLNVAISEAKTEIVFAGLPSLRFVKTLFFCS